MGERPVLQPRLRAIADLVPSGCRLADIGTDHGYIPVDLLLAGRITCAIATDIGALPLEHARQTADRCVKLAPDYSDGYLILGLAMVNKGDIQGGLSNLEKAKQLGNAQAQPLIDKYAKK